MLRASFPAIGSGDDAPFVARNRSSSLYNIIIARRTRSAKEISKKVERILIYDSELSGGMTTGVFASLGTIVASEAGIHSVTSSPLAV